MPPKSKKSTGNRGGRVAKPTNGASNIKSHFVQRKINRPAESKDTKQKSVPAVDVIESPSPEVEIVELQPEREVEIPVPEEVQSLLAQKEMLLHMLKDFDLNYQYGPCVGLSRLERWQRAMKLDLEPPEILGKVLTVAQVKSDSELREALWWPTL
ncbi:hypothetical protein HK097_000130 [Rhizophlyctis rosea]|uniref:DNA polymerase delta subunit 4 n=1 Tax=Rhizophlyctis rosea TaxID=64517 RepID=A0AAD5SGJ4_9FUNG|nr:hypothetical protein HK097_000130 [Rhizophlyctis rosea]